MWTDSSALGSRENSQSSDIETCRASCSGMDEILWEKLWRRVESSHKAVSATQNPGSIELCAQTQQEGTQGKPEIDHKNT